MKTQLLVSLVATSVGWWAWGGPEPEGSLDTGTVEVLILGTYHFANPGLDLVNSEVDDVLSETRQAEIQSVADALARFSPDKILLEMLPSAEEAFNERYRRYIEGALDLDRNERDQLGIRLAAMCNHERLYGIDSAQDLDMQGVLAAAAEGGQGHVAEAAAKMIGKIRSVAQEIHAGDRSTAAMLRDHNGADERFNSGVDSAFYMLLTEVGETDQPRGADLVADWHRRNLRIFANLLRALEEGDDRLLVIIGSGHRRLLEQFTREHPRLELVSALEYLPEE